VEAGQARATRWRVTLFRNLRWEAFGRSIRKAFRYPFESIWRNRRIIRSMVRRDILARYRGSFAGAFWAILNPLLLMLTYFFVFGVVLQARFGNDPSRSGFVLYFLAGMLPWLAFSEAVGRAAGVIREHGTFVKKLVFPVETLPVNLVASGLVTQFFASGIFAAGLLLARGGVPLTAVWLPFLIIPQALLTLGIAWFLAALGVYVRDLGQINGYLLTLWFFLTPICYPVAALPPGAAAVLSKNPMFVLVEAYRDILLEGRMPAPYPMAKLWVLSFVLFIAGHAWFHKMRKSFPDVL
jgi:lipopolysaccharide transport system permease protein